MKAINLFHSPALCCLSFQHEYVDTHSRTSREIVGRTASFLLSFIPSLFFSFSFSLSLAVHVMETRMSKQAKDLSVKTGRWLLVNIQKADVFDSHMLNRDIWRAEIVQVCGLFPLSLTSARQSFCLVLASSSSSLSLLAFSYVESSGRTVESVCLKCIHTSPVLSSPELKSLPGGHAPLYVPPHGSYILTRVCCCLSHARVESNS